MIISHASLRGPVRETQEDAHMIIQKGNTHMWGVFDGHGGATVSAYLKEYIPKALSKRPFPMTESKLVRLFDKVQERLVAKHSRAVEYQGSTCACIVKSAEHFTVINVGDSRIVMCVDEKAVPLTIDHKPNHPAERKRIEDLGGESKISKDMGDDWRVVNLSVSRSFGDLDAVPYVTHTPDVKLIPITGKEKFIIVACDGLWDVFSNEGAVKFVNDHLKYKDKIASLLAKEAIKLGSTDNVTVIVILL